MIDIVQALSDKKLFGALIEDQRSWENWKVLLKAVFGLHLFPDELTILKKLTGREHGPGLEVREFWAIVGRGGGKSFTSALVAVFLAVFKDWSKVLGPGEVGYIQCFATDRRQAGIVLNYIREILRLPAFRGRVRKDKAEEIELKSGIRISVILPILLPIHFP